MRSRHYGIGLIFLLSSLAAACGAKSINQVLADPAKYRNQNVTVHGTVDESASVMGRGAYRIADGDQKLWVVTSGGAPRKGARVNVTGHLQEGYDLSGFGSVLKLPGSMQSGLVLVRHRWCGTGRGLGSRRLGGCRLVGNGGPTMLVPSRYGPGKHCTCKKLES